MNLRQSCRYKFNLVKAWNVKLQIKVLIKDEPECSNRNPEIKPFLYIHVTFVKPFKQIKITWNPELLNLMALPEPF